MKEYIKSIQKSSAEAEKAITDLEARKTELETLINADDVSLEHVQGTVALRLEHEEISKALIRANNRRTDLDEHIRKTFPNVFSETMKQAREELIAKTDDKVLRLNNIIDEAFKLEQEIRQECRVMESEIVGEAINLLPYADNHFLGNYIYTQIPQLMTVPRGGVQYTPKHEVLKLIQRLCKSRIEPEDELDENIDAD